jgi:MFS family permease
MKTASRNTGSTMPSRLQVVLALGTTQTLAFGSTYYLPAILAVPMADALDLGTGTVYAAFSLALLVSGLLGPMIGRRIDRLGGRDVLVVSNLLFALGLGLLGVTAEPVLLFAAWLIIGIGMGMGLYEAAFATLAGLYGHAARNPITGITLIAGFASTVAWPLTAWLDLAVGWRGACLFWAAVHLVVCLPLNRFLVPKPVLPVLPQKRETAGDTAAAPRPRFRPGEIRIIATLGFVFAAAWFVSTALAAHLPRLLAETGVSPATALAASMLVGPAQVAARMVEFAFLQRSTRWSRRASPPCCTPWVPPPCCSSARPPPSPSPSCTAPATASSPSPRAPCRSASSGRRAMAGGRGSLPPLRASPRQRHPSSWRSPSTGWGRGLSM